LAFSLALGACSNLGGTDIAAVITASMFVALAHVNCTWIYVESDQHAQAIADVAQHSGELLSLFI